MKTNWPAAIDFILRMECNPGETETGSYHNDPNDPGGDTKFGIAQRSHPEVVVKDLTKDQAVAIYRKDYADPIHFDDLPSGTDLMVLDFAVNSGPTRALNYLHTSGDTIIGYKIGRISYYQELTKAKIAKHPEREAAYEKQLKEWLWRVDKCYTLAIKLRNAK